MVSQETVNVSQRAQSTAKEMQPPHGAPSEAEEMCRTMSLDFPTVQLAGMSD